MALVAINTLFFSLALGLFVSALSRSPQKAMAATLLCLLLLAAVLPATGSLLAALGKTHRVEPIFLLASPGYTYYLALDISFKTLSMYYWYSLLATHGLSWCCLVLACLIVPRTWQDRPSGAQGLRWRERLHLWTYGGQAERVAFRRRLLDRNAFLWLAARARLKPATVWGFLGLVACGWVWGLAKFRRDWLNEGMYLATALLINLTLRCWFAGEATRPLAEERKSGTLALLLSTPLSIREIMIGQRQALMRQFLGPVLAGLFVECLFLFAILRENFAEAERSFTIALWMAGMIMMVADLVALYWIGMWQGLTAKNPARAAIGSLSRVLIVPWLLIALVMLFVVLASMSGVREPDPWWKFFLGLWFVLGLLVDFGFSAYAHQKLNAEFRFAAQQRYAATRGFLRRLAGR